MSCREGARDRKRSSSSSSDIMKVKLTETKPQGKRRLNNGSESLQEPDEESAISSRSWLDYT